MKRFKFIAVALVVSTSTAEVASASGLLPVGQDGTRFLYERMLREQATDTSRFDFQVGPYPIERFDLDGTPFKSLAEIADYRMTLFSSVGENFSAQQKRRHLAYEAIRGGLALRPTQNLFVYGNFVLDEQRAKDPGYVGKKWRGLAGDVEQAFAHWQTPSFNLTAGRFASFWGAQNSLVLGPAQSLDGLAYSYRWGKLTLSYRLARLDPFTLWQDDSSRTIENRYFAGHRLDLQLSNRLRLGFFETVVFGGEGRQIELYYLNPLIFFHGSQVNEGSNDNTFIGFDFSVKPRLGWQIFGQLLVDDLQVEKNTQGDQEPNEIGLLAGCYLADLFPALDVSVEYSRVTNWSYNQDLPRNRYLFKGELISAARGNDYDLTDIRLIRWFGKLTRISFEFSYFRQGEGRVDAAWTEPWLTITGSYHETFPTGVVESSTSLSLGAQGYLYSRAAYDFEAGITRVDNVNHQKTAGESVPFIRLSLTASFSTILDAR